MNHLIGAIGLSLSAAGVAWGGCGSSCGGTTTAQHEGVRVINAGYGAEKDIVETAIAAGSFSTLATALTEAGLVETLKGEGPFTVFAPTDEAFAKLPRGTVEHLLRPENRDQLVSILTYHVVPGKVTAREVVKLDTATTVLGQRADITADRQGVQIDGANVIKTDIMASNGVIHVIDEVILPVTDDIPTVAASAEKFQTLLTAVKAAGLESTLMGDGPFTVFAPTDEAFGRLADGTVESLLRPENREKLRAVLTYHVVPGRVYASDVVKLNAATTVQGSDVRVRTNDTGVVINDARVIATDIEARNGVIHVIDTVLIPG